MKKQYRIINKGKGVLNINPSNLQKIFSGDSGNITPIPKDLIVPIDKLIVFKTPPNIDNTKLEIGDTVKGFVEGEFINAEYLGPDKALLTSFNI